MKKTYLIVAAIVILSAFFAVYFFAGEKLTAFECGEKLEHKGESYRTVEIGDRCWMAENLSFDYGCGEVEWEDEEDSGWCGHYRDEKEHGLLYQWSAAMEACPEGWELPCDETWKEMETAIGMSPEDVEDTNWRGDDEGSKMSTGADLWNEGALIESENFDKTGFDAVPAGQRRSVGAFSDRGTYAVWWTSTEENGEAWRRRLHRGFTNTFRNLQDTSYAYSVRCVKVDTENGEE